jgi:ribonuclease P protein component
MAEPGKSYTFDATRRLHGSIAFQSVYDAKLKKSVGPLAFFGKANGLDHPRLGLSVPRRAGNAVKRGRIKRLLREAFRLSQHDWPRGYDVIIAVRPHDVATLAEYQRLLFSAIRSLHLEHERRERRDTQP